MNIYDIFSFLVNDYKLNYVFQEFSLSGGVIAQEYSFYNKTGCFTIHSLPVRNELEFYYAKFYYANITTLQEKLLNVYNIEKDIWNKKSKWFNFIPNPFFWLDKNKILMVVAEVIKAQIKKNKNFFDIEVN